MEWREIRRKLAKVTQYGPRYNPEVQHLRQSREEDIIYFGFPSLFHICCCVIVRHGITQSELDRLPEEVQEKVIQCTPFSW